MSSHEEPPISPRVLISTESLLVGVRGTVAPLLRAGPLQDADYDAGVERLTETAANCLNVARASVWRYDATRRVLVCVDLFTATDRAHAKGVEIDVAATPRYLAALTRGGAIAAHDAQHDPRTSEFTDGYLAPLRITSMLDASVLVQRELEGVVCCEHVGDAPRPWSAVEVQAALMFADLATLIARARRKA